MDASEKLAEAVRVYLVLHKADPLFKDRNKNQLAWNDVAVAAGFVDGMNIFQSRVPILI